MVVDRWEFVEHGLAGSRLDSSRRYSPLLALVGARAEDLLRHPMTPLTTQ